MIIGIILHPYGENGPAGLARTIFELTKAMIEEDKKNSYVVFLKNQTKEMPDFTGENWKVEVLGGGRFWLDKLKYATKADVYVFNTPVLPLFYRPKRSVIIALDFAFYYLPKRRIKDYLRSILLFWHYKFSLRRADAIVAISEATKRDLISLFDIPEDKVDVILCGFKNIALESEEVVELPNKFLLFVGVIKYRKNVLNVVRAFAELAKDNEEYKLVIAGKGGGEYKKEIGEFIESRNLEKRVCFLGHLNDNQLSYVYKRAEALVFPSRAEGFGFPVLEAMATGLPVITSNTSSLPEVAGEAALLVDPENTDEIVKAMREIVFNGELRERLIRRGRERAKIFSWKKSAEKMLRVLERVGGN